MEKIELDLSGFYDFDSLFPLDYFEIKISTAGKDKWYLFYLDEQGNETQFGPYREVDILPRVNLAPFYFEEIVFVYYLIETRDDEVRNLGIRLLKRIAKA